ncbi:MAG: hypothetical protein V2B15_04160 [Bacteroidota bacterium]
MRYRFIQLLIFMGLFVPGQANGQIKLGQWRTHLPYKYCILAEATDDRIFCSSTGGLFTYNLLDNSVEKLSKIDGLSDNGLSAMRWSNDLKTLVLAYQNSNIDIIRGGVILNIPDLMKKQIPGDKSVYDIFYYGHYAYLSTGFGIVVLNLEKDEIKDTYYIGDNGNALKVNQVTIDGTYIYAATEQGIRRGLISDPFLVDYNAWEVMNELPNAGGSFSAIAFFNNAFFASYRDPSGIKDEVYYNTGGAWVDYPYFTGTVCREILNHGNFMTLVDDIRVNLISNDFLVVKQLQTSHPMSASLDKDDYIWAADYGKGMVTNRGGGSWTVIPDGPQSAVAFEMASAGNILYTVQGGIDGSWNNLFHVATMETFSDETWSFLQNGSSRDLVVLAIDPSDPEHLYAGSWGYGLHEYRAGEEIAQYKESNSSMQSIYPGADFIRIGGVAFDPMGNLWITNSNVAEPISVLKADGSWKSFRADNKISEFDALSRILVTSSGHKWVIIPRGNGLFAMDDNGTIDDASDDDYQRVSVKDKYGKVITNAIRSFAEDLNGNLWLGTNQGILVIYSPYRLFTEGEVTAQEIIVPRKGEVKPDGTIPGDVLLGEQVVTAIEVDGANRKWLGTAGGGVYLVSEDGLEEIHQFNEANSPLLSDNIQDICVDGVSGEVYFATEKGIISYKGEALTGSPLYNNVVVFPNPVRETYNGPVAIKGLMEKTTVKIQDMGGNLVYETESMGGQALWDGTNFRGERVATGVYLIFLSSEKGDFSHVTKLLFIH